MKRVFIVLIAGTLLSGIAAYAATQSAEAKQAPVPVVASN